MQQKLQIDCFLPNSVTYNKDAGKSSHTNTFFCYTYIKNGRQSMSIGEANDQQKMDILLLLRSNNSENYLNFVASFTPQRYITYRFLSFSFCIKPLIIKNCWSKPPFLYSLQWPSRGRQTLENRVKGEVSENNNNPKNTADKMIE